MKKINLIFILTLILSFSLILTSCDKTAVPTASTSPQEAISFEETSYYLQVGDMKKIRYSIVINDGSEVNFSSSDSTVAMVTRSGYIRADKMGECIVSLSYGEHTYYLYVYVSREVSFSGPDKTVYERGSSIDLTGASIRTYLPNGDLSKVIPVTSDMISGFDSSTLGEKTVSVKYENATFHFTVAIIKVSDAKVYEINDLVIPTMLTGEVNTFKAIAKYAEDLEDSVVSFYDYQELELVMDIKTPSNETDTIYAYYTKDYSETKINLGSMNHSLRTEGGVNDKEGYTYKTILTEAGQAYFAFNYNPSEVGTYQYELTVLLGEEIAIFTSTGSFTTEEGSSSKGVIRVSDNKSSFVYENGETFIPIGANLSWYTSLERRYNDFALWKEGLRENNINFIRYWLSAFGGALFWDDVENYDTRLDKAYENDRIFEMMNEDDIKIDLTIFHHGMFSKKTNSMWDKNGESWYISRYGYNPYSEKLSTSGEFFTDSYAIKWCKNYLKYIVARYTSFDNLMSYELFNEVDWVEEYTASNGTKWHNTMANYLKAIDYKKHLITSSTTHNGSSGYSTNANQVYEQLFALDSIDYVSLHHYGANNFFSFIPLRGGTVQKKFNKPVMFQEMGYSGNSGADQMLVDKNNISLHASIWAGMMSISSSALPWWWDGWLEGGNAWSEYQGATAFIKDMNLEGEMQKAFDGGLSFSHMSTRKMGYIFNNRAYLYLVHSSYNVGAKTNYTANGNLSLTLDNGTYQVAFFNTYTGDKIKEEEVTTSSNGLLTFRVDYTNDIAIKIIKK